MFVRSLILRLVLALGVFLGQASAQVADLSGPNLGPDAAGATSPDPGTSQSSGQTSSPAGGWEFTEWPVLVIPGVVALPGLEGSGAVFGVGLSSGYGQLSSTGTPTSSGDVSVAQPYVGLFQAGPRHKVMLEYSPTINFYNKEKADGTVLQRAGLRSFVDLSRRWRWVFSGYGTSGTEYMRELSGLGMAEYPGWLTFTVPSELVRFGFGSTGLHWRSRPLQEISLTVADSYSSIHNGPHFDGGFARVQVTNYFGKESNWYLFAQNNRFSSQPDCTRVEPGAGFVYGLNTSTKLSFGAAPVIGTGTCTIHLTGDFFGRLIQRITPKTLFYLSAARDLIEPYLLQSRWTDIYGAKIYRKISRTTSFSLGAAYAHSSDLPDTDLSRYRGLQAFSEFGWHLSQNLRLVASYRYFKRDFNLAHDLMFLDEVKDPSFETRNSWVFLSLVWHPVNRNMRRD